MPRSSLRARTRNVTDPRAVFEALFAEHWSAVHAYARRRVPTADDAHDVAAETFTVAWRRLADIPPDHVLPWLYRTAANVLHNQARGDRRRLRLGAKLAALPDGHTEDPADIATDDRVLLDAFSTLSGDDREVLRLVAWEGLTNPEIAVALETSTNAAALRVSRARQRLSRAIATAEGDAPVTAPPPSGHAPDDPDGATARRERRPR